jgi:hypothetical protein
MRGLKSLVIVLGVLLVGGMAVLVATMAWRASHPAPSGAMPGSPQVRLAAPGRPPYESTLDLPQGAEIVASQAAGDRLILQLGLPDGRRQLVIIDMGSGARLGTIELRPGS